MDANVILTSTVIAAAISLLANVYTSRRTANLKYITEERQKWREEIRKIAEDIVDCPRDEIKKHLTKLKVRINANGKLKKGSYYEDSHIWKLIHDIENSNICNECFEGKKEILINSLSLLLKYDWERQKREVLGTNIDRMRIILTCALLLILFANGKYDITIFLCSMSILYPSTLPLLKQWMIRAFKENNEEEFYKKTGILCVIPGVIVGSLGIIFYMQILTDKNWLILFSLIIAFSLNYMLGLARPVMAIHIVRCYERNVATLLNESI